MIRGIVHNRQVSFYDRLLAGLLIGVMGASILFAATPRVSVSISENDISLKERFQLTFTFENFSGNPEPDISRLKDFTVISGPSKSNQYSWINGQSTKVYSVTYTLAPLKTGHLTIPSYTFQDKRRTFQTEALTIQVREPEGIPDTRAGQTHLKPFYFELIPSTHTPYVGEPLVLTYKIYFRENIRNYHVDKTMFTGYLTDYLPVPRNPVVKTETVQGVSYKSAILQKVILTPAISGRDTIPSQVIRLEVESPRQGRRSIFDDPFGMGIQLRNVDVVSPELILNIRPLPPDPPASFTGAVGSFTLHAAFDTVETEENQAVTLKIEVKGKGNFKNFTFPKPKFPDQFMVFEPETQENVHLTDEGYTGSKIWEYVIIPNYQGTYYFEPVEFSYFSPKDGKYRKQMVSDLILTVTPNTRLIREQQQGLSRREVELLSQDIRFIQLKEGRIMSEASRHTIRPVDWAGYGISFIICLIWAVFAGTKKFLERNPTYVRKKAAYRTLETSVRDLPADADEVIRMLPKLFARYVSDKEGHGRQNLTRSDVMAYCREKIHDQTLLHRIDNWWKEVEFLNYLPSDTDYAKVQELKEEMLVLIRHLEKKR